MNKEFRSISETCEVLIPDGHACVTLYLEQHTIHYDLLLALQGSHLPFLCTQPNRSLLLIYHPVPLHLLLAYEEFS